jgi:hypothetical protein
VLAGDARGPDICSPAGRPSQSIRVASGRLLRLRCVREQAERFQTTARSPRALAALTLVPTPQKGSITVPPGGGAAATKHRAQVLASIPAGCAAHDENGIGDADGQFRPGSTTSFWQPWA